MKFFTLIFSLIFSLVSHAQDAVTDTARVYIVNPEIRFERDSSQEIAAQNPLGFALEYKRNDVGLALEYARFQENSGNATSSLERIHQDYLLWLKFHFFGFTNREVQLSLFAGPGVGTYQESVNTSFMGASRTDHGGYKFMSGLVAGGELVRIVNQSFSILMALEGRALISSEFEPNPILSGVLRFGVQIPVK